MGYQRCFMWETMIQRCHSPTSKDYPGYGGIGITVCDRWRQSRKAFIADMGPRPSPEHTIDRIDNALGYTPANCRWATRKEQARNRRSNTHLLVNGERVCLSELAERHGLPRQQLRNRLVRGWSLERALSVPVQHKATG